MRRTRPTPLFVIGERYERIDCVYAPVGPLRAAGAAACAAVRSPFLAGLLGTGVVLLLLWAAAAFPEISSRFAEAPLFSDLQPSAVEAAPPGS